MAQYFYRQGKDIYNASNQKLIGSDEWNKNWTGRATELTAIDGAKYNTADLQKANYSNITRVGNTLYGAQIKQPATTTPSVTSVNELIDKLPSNNVDIANERLQNSILSATDNAAKAEAERVKAAKMLETAKKEQEAQAKLDTIQADTQRRVNKVDTEMQPIIDRATSTLDNISSAFSVSKEEALAAKEKITTYSDSLVQMYKDYQNALNGAGHAGQTMSQNAAEINRIQKNYQSNIAITQSIIEVEKGNLTYATNIIQNAANSLNSVNQSEQTAIESALSVNAYAESNATTKLSTLTADVKTQYNDYLADLKAEAENIENNKTLVMNMFTNKESAELAVKSGIALTDNQETIYKKLTSYIAANPSYYATDGSFDFVKGSDGTDYVMDKKSGQLTPANGMTDPITGAKTDPSKVIMGYDFTSYAKDTSWGNSVKAKLAGMPQFNTADEINDYISQTAHESVLAGQGETIMQVAKQYDIDVNLLMAMIAHESVNGTSNVAKKNNNFGGITWNSNFPESMKGTARPSNAGPSYEGGNYVKFATVAEGVANMASNIARRKISVNETVSPTVEALKKMVENGKLTEKEAITQASDNDKESLIQSLSNIEKKADNASLEKSQQAKALISHPGLGSAVGYALGRVAMPWDWSNKDSFIASVEQLVEGMSLESLISAKERGATFGALSNAELRMLAASATKIGTWRQTKDGKVTGYKIGEEEMKKELKNISSLLAKDSQSSQLGVITQKISQAESNGYSATEILDYLDDEDNELEDKINQARQNNYSDEEILNFLKK